MTGTPFALGTFRADDGRVFSGLVQDAGVRDLSVELSRPVTLRSLLFDWDAATVELQKVADRRAEGASLPLEDLKILPPVDSGAQIFQAGANYRQHVLDLLMAAERRGDRSDGLVAGARERARSQLDERAQSGRPFVFLGSFHAVVGAHDRVVLPSDGHQHDWELELAAVIGRPARRVGRDDALNYVAGYTICNDLTTRDALNRADNDTIGLDWLAGKNAPTFLPTGPYLVPAVHAGDPMNLRIELRLNGKVMQDESTADMLFDVASIVEHISHVAELRPGDLVLTGSPAGNGASHGRFLKDGDEMEGEITGLGVQHNRCVAEAPVPVA